jgi:hypothetical protein
VVDGAAGPLVDGRVSTVGSSRTTSQVGTASTIMAVTAVSPRRAWPAIHSTGGGAVFGWSIRGRRGVGGLVVASTVGSSRTTIQVGTVSTSTALTAVSPRQPSPAGRSGGAGGACRASMVGLLQAGIVGDEGAPPG